jgi:hypothetical protein
MNKLELCQKLIEEAMKCLENNDRECVMRLIEELVRNQCHDGRLIGKEVADGVRKIVHELWIISNHEEICRLLRMLKSLDVSKKWIIKACATRLNTWLTRCRINWESRITRNNVTKSIENLLRKKLDWNEIKMCEEVWRFIGIDVNVFRKYGIEPCSWLKGLEELNNLKNPYWFGLKSSDLAVSEIVREHEKGVGLKIDTTNTISAIFFPMLLRTIKTPSLKIMWKKAAPTAKYVSISINLSYYVVLNANAWPWPELSVDELERIIEGFTDEELAMFIAGLIDGDGSVWYDYNSSVYVKISACKACPKRMVLGILRDIIAKRFGIIGRIYPLNSDDLMFYDESAVRLLRLIRPFVHHPLRRLRIELILALHDGKISREAFEKLYKMTEYEYKGPDIKRNHALEALARAAPQTHTHGELGSCLIDRCNLKTKTTNKLRLINSRTKPRLFSTKQKPKIKQTNPHNQLILLL